MALREAHPLERAVGVGYYVSDADGTGGRLRARPADFRVRELERFAVEPLDADPDAYPHLVLRATLENWDTNRFAGALSDRLAMSRERVSWAGTKDKRAVTTQLVSLRGPELDPDDLPELRGAEIEPVGRAGRALAFGDLAGNAFEIVVSDADRPGAAAAVTDQLAAIASGEGPEGTAAADGDATPAGEAGPAQAIEPATETVAVPNYFGQQRFGSRRAITHEVGFALLRGDWRGAVLAYCGAPSEREPADSQAARETVEAAAASADPDWAAALAAMPDRLGHERAMLGALAERDAPGPAGADDGEAATRAYEPGGEDDPFRVALETTPTSLQRLFVNAAQSALFNRIVTGRLERGLSLTRPVVGDVVCFAETVDAAGAGGGSGRGDDDRTLPLPDADRLQRVDADRLATVRRHCERGRAFVTAPLVGTETAFGDGQPGEIERAVCADAGIEPGDFELPGRFHSAGTRRAVAVRTTLDVAPVADREDAYELAFALPSGSYATVVLREYLKVDPDDL